jgi:5-methylcytosine-specific restriction endonuclease McrA
MQCVTIPDWEASRAGARTRVALWLATQVGEGGTFTKAQLREAFPAVEQIDRRMRDLRPEGWTIATYREDRSLSADELRLVKIGGPVWERGYRSQAKTPVSDKERQAILAADEYACCICGVTGGEVYADDPIRTAKLSIARVEAADGSGTLLQTLCERCHVALTDGDSASSVLAAAQDLPAQELAQLRSWIANGQRPRSAADIVWGRLRRLPSAARHEVVTELQAATPATTDEPF